MEEFRKTCRVTAAFYRASSIRQPRQRTPSLAIRPLPSDSKSRYPAPSLLLCQTWLCHQKGITKFSVHLSTKRAPSPLPVTFLNLPCSCTGIHKSPRVLCITKFQMHCKMTARNQFVLTHGLTLLMKSHCFQ